MNRLTLVTVATMVALVVGCDSRTAGTRDNADLQSIRLEPEALSVSAGAAVAIEAFGTYPDGEREITVEATWSSSDEAVGIVGDEGETKGRFEALAAGSVTVEASLGARKASLEVEVTGDAPADLAIEPAEGTVAAGTALQLRAIALYDGGGSADLTSSVLWSSSDDAVATVSAEGEAHAQTPGEVTITALAAGGLDATMTLTVTDAILETVDVTPKAPSLPVGASAELTATGVFDDGSKQDLTTQVTWSSGDDEVATVDDAGRVTGVEVGEVSITASFGSVEGSINVTVTDASLTAIELTPTSASLVVGSSEQFLATGIYDDGSTLDLTNQAQWSSGDDAIAVVSDTGWVTAVAAGSVTITASQAGIMGEADVSVRDAQLESLSISPANPSLAAGTSMQLTVSGSYDDGTTEDLTAQVTWASNEESVASVSNADGSEGRLRALSAGTATITATLGAESATVEVTVTGATLQSIAVTPTNPVLAVGNSLQLTATGTFSDSTTQDLTADAVWSSGDESVATVSNGAGSEGLLEALAAGSSSISARIGDVSGATLAEVTSATLEEITITPSNASVAAGTEVQLTATGRYSDDSTFDLTAQATWSSENTEVVTVANADGSEGLATAVAEGSTTVSATFDGVEGSTPMTVTAATLESIAIDPADPQLAAGTTVQLTATGTYSDDSTQDITTQVTWSSDDEAIAEVSNASGDEGLVTGVAVGTTAITASLNGVDGSTDVTVTDAALDSIDVTPVDASIALGTTQQYTATGNYSDGSSQDITTQVTWSSSDDAVATISNQTGEEGLATSQGTGTADITAALSGVSGTTSLTVTDATLQSITVTPASATVGEGETVQYSATGSFSDGSSQDLTTQATWGSVDPTVASVSNADGTEGLATGEAEGSTDITATFDDITGSASITVSAAVIESITLEPVDPEMAIGTTQQFIATATYTDGSTEDVTTQVTWASSEESVATVSNQFLSEGEVEALAEGTTTISASLDGVEGSTTLTVTPAVLISIEIDPATACIPPSDFTPPTVSTSTQQFIAYGTFDADGDPGTTDDQTVQDITEDVTWESSSLNVATIGNSLDTNGLATACGEMTCPSDTDPSTDPVETIISAEITNTNDEVISDQAMLGVDVHDNGCSG